MEEVKGNETAEALKATAKVDAPTADGAEGIDTKPVDGKQLKVHGGVQIIAVEDGSVKVMSSENMSMLEVIGLVAKGLSIVSMMPPAKAEPKPMITPVKGSVPFQAFRGGGHGKGRR